MYNFTDLDNMKTRPSIPFRILFTGLCSLLLFAGNSFPQKTTFGDLIPVRYLPPGIKSSDPINCDRYFKLADSINQYVFNRTGKNPVPEFHCGNDTLTYSRRSIEDALNEISIGSVLARMVIDRSGSPVCCKVYMKGADNANKQVENTLSKLVMMPSFRNGEPIPTECRYVYDFLAPKTSGRNIID